MGKEVCQLRHVAVSRLKKDLTAKYGEVWMVQFEEFLQDGYKHYGNIFRPEIAKTAFTPKNATEDVRQIFVSFLTPSSVPNRY